MSVKANEIKWVSFYSQMNVCCRLYLENKYESLQNHLRGFQCTNSSSKEQGEYWENALTSTSGTLGENFLIFLFAEHFKVAKSVSLVYNTNSLRERYLKFSFAIPNGDQLSSGCNQLVSLYWLRVKPKTFGNLIPKHSVFLYGQSSCNDAKLFVSRCRQTLLTWTATFWLQFMH